MTGPSFRNQVRDRAASAGLAVDPSAIDSLEAYFALLSRWNERINLTALPLTGWPAASIDRLLIEPLVAAELVEPRALRWADLGSGGGSPAIPMKLVRPAACLQMIESRSKKVAFLREVVRALELVQAEVVHCRIDEFLSSESAQSIDLVTVRAVKTDAAALRSIGIRLASRGQLLIFGTQAPLPQVEGFSETAAVQLPGKAAMLHVLSRRTDLSP